MVTITDADLVEHPAVEAWAALGYPPVRPNRIIQLNDQPKSKVCRLQGIGPPGSLIAKRCLQDTAQFERSLYEEIFPHLPVSTLQYFGFVDEPDSEFSWLFLEDAGEAAYSPLNREHSRLALQWLSRMHTSAELLAAVARLPDRGPSHYLEHLRSGSDRIRQNLANPLLTADDVILLKTIISYGYILEARWAEVEHFCEGIPQTLVHGDFVAKNICVRQGTHGSTLLPFDWEMAGYGVPAVDIALCPDSEVYWSLVRNTWPQLTVEHIRRVDFAGRIFRTLASINWESWGLVFEWADQYMRAMRSYESTLVNLLRVAGWVA